MEEKTITQEALDRIIKRNSAKYLKKLEEKEAEMNRYKEVLESIGHIVSGEGEVYTGEQPEASAKPLSDDEVISTVEGILSIPSNERSAEDEETLASLKEHYGHAMYRKDVAEAKAWAEENYDGDIDEILNNEEFLDFISDINGKVPALIKKYLKYTSKTNDSKNAVRTPGSVKDTSGVVAKEYFSKEEVEKMTPEQLKKYMPVIENSMSKW